MARMVRLRRISASEPATSSSSPEEPPVLPQALLPSFRERVLIVGLPSAPPILEALEAGNDRRFTIVGLVDDVAPADAPCLGPPLLGPLARLAEIVEELR